MSLFVNIATEVDDMKKKVCILFTGGTIGMVPTENGYAPKKNYFEEVLRNTIDETDEQIPDWDLVEFDPLLDSSNMSVKEWNMISNAIKERYDDYDGFVILHGTDTMAYTASALSYSLENLGKPVILTGSQIPLCRVRSDAKDNILCSMIIASQGIANEVGLFFCGRLFRGNRATKASADDIAAFDSPNYPPLATVGIDIKYNLSAIAKPGNGKLFRSEYSEVPIAVLKFFPGMQFSLFENIITDSLDGLVLEAFGAGNIPSSDAALPGIIKRAFDKGTIVTVCSQCQKGSVALGAYETSSPLKKAGAVSGYNMTTEAAITKLYYLFSQGYSKERIKAYMETDIRGEMDV